jgi:hypothetical protein
MNANRWLLLVNLAVGFYNVGLIWLTQVVCYPLWGHVGKAEFSQYHLAWWHGIWGVCFVPAGLAVLGAMAMLWLRPPGVPASAVRLGLALQAATWVLTALWWAPLQMRIEEGGFSVPVFRLLLETHWGRVALVTAYGFLLFWMAARAWSEQRLLPRDESGAATAASRSTLALP